MPSSSRGLNWFEPDIEGARGVVTVLCHGKLVCGQETALLCAVMQEHERDIILDLSGVTAIDAAGIGALVSLVAAGIYLRVVAPSRAVRQVLRLQGLDSVLEMSESEFSEKAAAECSFSVIQAS
jgi:anti-anti-sigma factor